MHLDFNSTSCSCPVLIPILFEYFTLMALQMKQNSTLTPPPPYMKQHSSSSRKEKSRSCSPIQVRLITEVGKENKSPMHLNKKVCNNNKFLIWMIIKGNEIFRSKIIIIIKAKLHRQHALVHDFTSKWSPIKLHHQSQCQ